jgi:hypothetical protein
MNRISEEVGDRGEMYLVLIIAIGTAIEQKGCGLWVGYNSGVHAAILYRKMAVSMPKCLVKRGDPRRPTSAEQAIPAQWVEAFGEGDAPAPPRAGRHANRKDRRRRGILCKTRPQWCPDEGPWVAIETP